jgi:DNA primase
VIVALLDRKWDWAKVRVWTKRFAEGFAERDPALRRFIDG